MRLLNLFLAVMFFANNAVAAVRACSADHAMQGRAAISAPAGAADQAPCPQDDDAGPCLKHYAQAYESSQGNESCLWNGFSPLVFIPTLAVVHASIQASPKLVAVAAAPPRVGPPLTILFGNFRR